MESGRPVLLVPYSGRFEHCGRRALIGWNATREAARAAFDAVPILKQADSVHVTWIDPQRSREEAGPNPGCRVGHSSVAAWHQGDRGGPADERTRCR
jgi:hypothetical protein